MTATDSQTVSVIIPTFNRAKQILAAIDSVTEQSVLPCEILVIDDGSSDNTADLLQEYHDLVRYVRKENGGVSSARNLGIKMATGRWVAFLDSDDVWLPTKLEKQLKCLGETGAQACFTGIATETGEVKGGFDEIMPGYPAGNFFFSEQPFEFLWKSERHPMVQTLLIERELMVNLGGFNEELSVAEDTALFYRIVLESGFSYVNSTLAILDRNREIFGLSDNPDPRKTVARYRCYLRVQSDLYWQVLTRDETARKHIEGRIGYFAARCSEYESANQRFKLSRSLAKLSLIYSPFRGLWLRCLVLAIRPQLLAKGLRQKWKIDQS